MTSPTDSIHSVSSNSQNAGETPPDHEAAFNQWNDALTQDFNKAHPGNPSPGGSLLGYPLYRATRQEPDNVFKPDGKLENSLGLRAGRPRQTNFGLSRHQMGLPSHYTSMTTSLPAASDVARWSGGNTVFVTDPQPHGRYLNGLGYDQTNEAKGKAHQGASQAKDKIGSIGNKDYALDRARTYPVTEDAMKQHEVAVPGPIPTESVRGSIPVNTTTGALNYAELRKNEHYMSPEDYKREFDGAAGLESGKQSG